VIINKSFLQELEFYARLFTERYGEKEQLPKFTEELDELKTALNEYYMYREKGGLKLRQTYEPVIEEILDVLIFIVQSALIFDDPALWLMKLLEKKQQWKEHLNLEY
jgi:NTP pyrophosphatase (non-canonical NTP hydrolase)